MRAGRVYLLVWNGFVWESGNMPICLATHVSVWFLFVSIILQRSLSLSLSFSLFFSLLSPLAAFGWLQPRPQVQVRWTSLFFKPLKVTRSCWGMYQFVCRLNVCARRRCNWAPWACRHRTTVLTAPLGSQWGSLSPEPLEALTPSVPLVPSYSAAHTPLTHPNEVICCRWVRGEHGGHRACRLAHAEMSRSGSYEGHLLKKKK